jgi:hypothetical protein
MIGRTPAYCALVTCDGVLERERGLKSRLGPSAFVAKDRSVPVRGLCFLLRCTRPFHLINNLSRLSRRQTCSLPSSASLVSLRAILQFEAQPRCLPTILHLSRTKFEPLRAQALIQLACLVFEQNKVQLVLASRCRWKTQRSGRPAGRAQEPRPNAPYSRTGLTFAVGVRD